MKKNYILSVILTTITISCIFIGISFKNAAEASTNTVTDITGIEYPPERTPTVVIRGETELIELLGLLELDNDELEDYLMKSRIDTNGIKNREDIETFLELINSLSLPIVQNAKFRSLMYSPINMSINISYEIDIGESYSFAYGLTWNTEEYIEERTGQKPVPIYQKEDGRIKVYNSTAELDPYAGFTRYLMDVDGHYVNVTYRNEGIKDFSLVTPDQVFGDMVLSTLQTITNYKSHDITVLLNGLYLDFDQPPIMENDRILVPFRVIYEAFGAKVEWDNATQTVTAIMGNKTIITCIDDKQISINGKMTPLDVPARLVGDRALVPIRAVSEGLGAKVDWDNKKHQVIITTD